MSNQTFRQNQTIKGWFYKHWLWKHGITVVYVLVIYDGFVLKWINSIPYVEQKMLVCFMYDIVTFPNSGLFITPTVIRCTFCMRCMASVVRSPRHNQPSDPNPPSKEPMDNKWYTQKVLLTGDFNPCLFFNFLQSKLQGKESIFDTALL